MTKSQPASFKHIEQLMSLVTLGANGCGALVTFLFFSFIYPVPQPTTTNASGSPWEMLSFFIFTALLLILGTVIDTNASRKMGYWYERLRAGESAVEVPQDVLLLVLNCVPRSALVTLAMWFLAGLFFSWSFFNKGMGIGSFLQGFSGIFGVGGVLTMAVAFFGSDLIWRQVIPVFFPDGHISRVNAFRLPVLMRLLIVFFLVSIVPVGMVVILSLQRAQMLVTGPESQRILDNLLVMELFIVGVSLLVNVSMVVFVTRSITGPIRSLQQAMGRVEANDFSTEVQVNTTDELGYLSEHFNQMTAGLRQGELLRNLLNLYVTPEVARDAVEHGVQLGGRLVECTVLFSDIRDFTGLTERMAPEELITLLNRYMGLMVDVVVSQGGLVNKFGGDSLLAVFGSPLNPAPDHAARGLAAAQGMLKGLEIFNQVQEQSGQSKLRIGIGVATGVVVAGNVGGRGRVEYTVIGDTVNLAARLQGMTKEIGHPILISEATYQSACTTANAAAGTQDFLNRAVPIQGVHVRGKEEPVNLFYFPTPTL